MKGIRRIATLLVGFTLLGMGCGCYEKENTVKE
jgi:hypothetical protein